MQDFHQGHYTQDFQDRSRWATRPSGIGGVPELDGIGAHPAPPSAAVKLPKPFP
jgi:hypothetical protein